MQLSEKPGEDALLGEDELPGIDADEIARPERQHDPEIEEDLPAAARVAGSEVGDRERDDRRRDGDERGHRDGADDDVEIGRRQKLRVGRERRLVDDQPGKFVEPEEALRKEGKERADIDQAEPDERRPEEKSEQDARVQIEDVGQATEQAAAAILDGAGNSGGRAHASSSVWSAFGFQESVTRSPGCAEGSLAGTATLISVPPTSTLTRVVDP